MEIYQYVRLNMLTATYSYTKDFIRYFINCFDVIR